eukprot:4765680-Pyramimonas_sp.AAC.1
MMTSVEKDACALGCRIRVAIETDGLVEELARVLRKQARADIRRQGMKLQEAIGYTHMWKPLSFKTKMKATFV